MSDDGTNGEGGHERASWLGEGDARNLASALRSVAMAETDRHGLMLRPSRLPPRMLRAQHRQRLRTALEPLLSANRARLFRLPDRTSVVLWRGDAGPYLRHTLELIAGALNDLPGGIVETAGMITLFELPRDTEMVLHAIEASLGGAPPRLPDIETQAEVAPLGIGGLATLEQALAQADVANLARRKPVCAVAPGGGMRLAWEKRFLSVSELAATLVPNTSPQAEPWLFRRLTRTLDRRMLALLAHPDELMLAGPFALNLNVASILSPHFTRFDGALPSRLRGEVMLDLTAADIMADLPAYLQARDHAQTRGYRLLLRGVTTDLMPVLPIEQLGLDLVQLRWSSQLSRLAPGSLARHIGSVERVVLGRADHQDAVDWGIAQGIGLFQGAAAQASSAQSRLPLSMLRRHSVRA